MAVADMPKHENSGIPHPSIVRLSSSALSLFDKLKALSAKSKGLLPRAHDEVPSRGGEGKIKGSGRSHGLPRPHAGGEGWGEGDNGSSRLFPY